MSCPGYENIYGDDILNGETYCDANGNLYVCTNGSIVSKGCKCTGNTYNPPCNTVIPSYTGTCNQNMIDYCVSNGMVCDAPTNTCKSTNTPQSPPTVSLVAFEYSGSSPFTVTFYKTISGNVTSQTLSFGDGTSDSSTSTSVSHTYTTSTSRSFTATLSASNSGGTTTNSFRIDVVPGGYPPEASGSLYPTSGNSPLTVSFSDTSDGATSRLWTFGDGGSSNSINGSHTYSIAGTYTAKLTVTNAYGSDSITQNITVIRDNTCTPYLSCPSTPDGGSCCDTQTHYNHKCYAGNWEMQTPCGTNNCTRLSGDDIIDGSSYCDTENNILMKCIKGGFYDGGVCPGMVQPKPTDGCQYGTTYNSAGEEVCAQSPVAKTCTFGGFFGIGATTLTEGQKFKDSKGDNYTCLNGELKFLGSDAPQTDCPTGYYMDITSAECVPSVIIPPVTPPTTPPVVSTPLVVKISTNQTNAPIPMVVKFTNTTIGAISHLWNFGDGTTSTAMSPPEKTYAKAGSYTVTYVAKGSDDKTDTQTITITATTSAGGTGIVKPVCTSTQTYNSTTNTCDTGSAIKPVCTSTQTYNATTNTCVSNTPGVVKTVPCVGMNRSGAFDVTCALEKGNENYLYVAAGAVGLLALILIMKNRG